MSACANWITLARLDMGHERTMATAHVDVGFGDWHTVSIVSNGTALRVSVNGTTLMTAPVLPDKPLGCNEGDDGCEADWLV